MTALSAAAIRSHAADAYSFGYALVENYRTLYAQAVDTADPRYVGGFGRYRHYSEPFTPENTDIVTPNNDTPYSWLWLDLRAEPWVISTPAIDRFFVIPIHELTTIYSGYIGARATGPNAGSYLIAGPDWDGPVPEGINGVIRSQTQFVGSLTRTALQADGVEGVTRVQNSYRVEPLSTFIGTDAPASSPVAWPVWDETAAQGLGFYDYLDFLLRFVPVVPEDEAIRARMAEIGLDGSGTFDSATLDVDTAAAFAAGQQQARDELEAKAKVQTSSIGFFGTREELAGKYEERNLGALLGIYGLPPEEAWYGGWFLDAEGKPFDGSHRYRVTFAAADLPQVRFFWSATLYTMPERLLSANSIDRYSIGDRTAGLRYADDGSLTLAVQHDEPTDPVERANWLPAPATGFNVILRAYGGDAKIVAGKYRLPALTALPES